MLSVKHKVYFFISLYKLLRIQLWKVFTGICITFIATKLDVIRFILKILFILISLRPQVDIPIHLGDLL